MRLQDRIAVVTGAASGIGRATALRLAAEGAFVCPVDRDSVGLDATVAALGERCAMPETLDISDETSVEAFVARVLTERGQVDILVNNAGILGSFASTPDQDLASWREVLAVNVYGAVAFTKHVSRAMIAGGRGGAIVNTASVAGIRSGAGGNAYSASKAAVINFTQTAACDLGGYGIRVNAVCPGLVESGMTREVFDYARANGKEERLGYRCELRRFGRPEEIAAAIAFLASDDASFITGQALAVDGGNTASLNLPGMKF